MNRTRMLKGWKHAANKYLRTQAQPGDIRVIKQTVEEAHEIQVNRQKWNQQKSDAARNHRQANLVGREFGRLLCWECVLPNRSPIWLCLCACGDYVRVAAHRLLNEKGGVTDCGCLFLESKRVKKLRRKLQRNKAAAEARAERERIVTFLSKRKRKPAAKYHGLLAA